MRETARLSAAECDEIAHRYFSGEKDDAIPVCPRCRSLLQVDSTVVPFIGLNLSFVCPRCRASGCWSQPQPERDWKPLHLEYFVERHSRVEPIRCPLDDCFVTVVEFSETVLQFNCPFCNRRGRVRLTEGDVSG